TAALARREKGKEGGRRRRWEWRDALPRSAQGHELHLGSARTDAGAQRCDRGAAVAELVDEAVRLGVAAAPHAALGDGVHLVARALATRGHDVDEPIVEVLDL